MEDVEAVVGRRYRPECYDWTNVRRVGAGIIGSRNCDSMCHDCCIFVVMMVPLAAIIYLASR